MAYCTVGLKSESGDSYTVLVEYRSKEDVSKYLKDIFEEEFTFISEVQVDSGVDSDTDDSIENVIYAAIAAESD